MNDFDVRLTTAAEDDLADIWLNSPDPASVTRADTTAAQMLRRDPLGTGILVAEELYRLIVAPLAYYYAVDMNAKSVEVSVIREVRS